MLGSLRLDMGDDISGRPLLRDALAKYDTLEEHDAFSPFGVASALRLLGSDEDGAHQGGARAARDAADAVDGGGVELPEQHSAWLGTGASNGARWRRQGVGDHAAQYEFDRRQVGDLIAFAQGGRAVLWVSRARWRRPETGEQPAERRRRASVQVLVLAPTPSARGGDRRTRRTRRTRRRSDCTLHAGAVQ